MNWLLLALAFATTPPKDVAKAYAESVKRVKQDRAAEVRTPPPPGAPASVQIPITGSAVDNTGAEYTFSGVVTLTRKDPPAPLVPTIVGTRAAGGTQFISEAISGSLLELVGTGLPTTGQLRLTVGDKTAVVKLWTPTLVQFVAPSTTSAYTAPTKIYQQINSQWMLIAQGPPLTLKSGVAEVPSLPRVDRFLAADGTAPAAFSIHQPLILEGAGFGAEKGRVLVNWLEVPVTAWSETRIQATAGDGTDPDGIQVQILTPSGWLHERGPKVILDALR